MKVTFFSTDEYRSILLPRKFAGRHWLKGRDELGKLEDVIAIEAQQESEFEKSSSWIVKSNKKFTVIDNNNNAVKSIQIKPNDIFRVSSYDGKRLYVLYVESQTDNRKVHNVFQLISEEIVLTVGSGADNDIVYSNRLISTKHAEIGFSSENIFVRDLGSKNKVYVNGEKVESLQLKPADLIYIMGLQIIVTKKYIFINNPDEQVSVREDKLRKYVSSINPSDLLEVDQDDDTEEENTYYYREPRFKYDVDVFDFRLDSSPSPPNTEEVPMMMLVGPTITMGMASLASGIFAVTSELGRGDITSAMPSLVMSMSMLLGTLMWPMLTNNYQRKMKLKKEEKRQSSYLAYIADSEKIIAQEINRQERILRNNDVNFITYMHRILDSNPLLWERTHKHSDFLSLRLGHGELPFKAKIQYSERKFSVENDNLTEEMYRFGEKQRVLRDVPICLPLADRFISGIFANKKNLHEYAKNLIIQITALW